MEEIIHTCGGVLFNEHRQVLLVEHKAGAEHKLGLYGFPAGKAVKGETDICTAIREIEEETGAVLKEIDATELPILYESIIETKEGSQHFTMRLFTAQVKNISVSESEETRPVWVSVEELKNLPLLPNVVQAVNDAQKAIFR